MDEASPLGVYLVKSGSKGDRLLFRYPYAVDAECDIHGNKKRHNPYALIVTEDILNATRSVEILMVGGSRFEKHCALVDRPP